MEKEAAGNEFQEAGWSKDCEELCNTPFQDCFCATTEIFKLALHMKKRSGQLFNNENTVRERQSCSSRSSAGGRGPLGEPSLPAVAAGERLPHLQAPGPPEASKNTYYNFVGIFILVLIENFILIMKLLHSCLKS